MGSGQRFSGEAVLAETVRREVCPWPSSVANWHTSRRAKCSVVRWVSSIAWKVQSDGFVETHALLAAERTTHMTDNQPSTRVGDVAPEATRWTHVCAWDGQELADPDFVQVSPHERVCRLHYPQFQKWLRETAKTMYHLGDEDEDMTKAPRAVPVWRRQRRRAPRRRRRN